VIYHCPEYYDGALVRLEDYDKLRHSLAERADRVSVPREPTDEMTEAFWRDYSVGERFVEGYRAMLSARPKE
jgi:isocitrate dehydrogenase kinase/phosphatase